MSKLGDNVRMRREALNMSQEELSKRLNYKHRSAINKLELGVSNFPISRIEEFATVLQTTVENLLGYDVNELKSGELYGNVKAVLIDNMRNRKQDPEYIQFAKKYACEIVEIVYGKSASKIVSRYDYLNERGKDKVSERLEELENLSQYTDQK